MPRWTGAGAAGWAVGAASCSVRVWGNVALRPLGTLRGRETHARTVSGSVYWWAIALYESWREIGAVSVLAVVGDLYLTLASLPPCLLACMHACILACSPLRPVCEVSWLCVIGTDRNGRSWDVMGLRSAASAAALTCYVCVYAKQQGASPI
jgi:hypothetical protein